MAVLILMRFTFTGFSFSFQNGPGRRGGKMNESLQLRLWNFNSTSNSPVAPRRLSCQIPANQWEAERAQMQTNIEKHVPRVMMLLQMSSPPISISHRLFRCRYSNFRDAVASSPSFSRAAASVPRRARSQATFLIKWNT